MCLCVLARSCCYDSVCLLAFAFIPVGSLVNVCDGVCVRACGCVHACGSLLGFVLFSVTNDSVAAEQASSCLSLKPSSTDSFFPPLFSFSSSPQAATVSPPFDSKHSPQQNLLFVSPALEGSDSHLARKQNLFFSFFQTCKNLHLKNKQNASSGVRE